MPQKLLSLIAVAHLSLVTCGACQVTPLSPASLGGSATQLYMTLSGADGYYGFFAPTVDAEIRIRFLLRDEDGRESFDTLETGATAEANLRLGAVGRLLPAATPERREELLRSLAAAVLTRHPEAVEVTVLIEAFGVVHPEGGVDVPSLQQARDGARSEWLLLQSMTFERPSGV